MQENEDSDRADLLYDTLDDVELVTTDYDLLALVQSVKGV